MTTFGAITSRDWEAYYKRDRRYKPLKDLPCATCVGSQGWRKCPRPECKRWSDWVRKWWPIVTGQNIRRNADSEKADIR